MTLHIPPVCLGCKHFNSRDDEQNTCRAFPEGIPAPIWLGGNQHTELYPGDHGKQYEPGPPHDA